jgi:hypothetical protein
MKILIVQLITFSDTRQKPKQPVLKDAAGQIPVPAAKLVAGAAVPV